MSQYNHYNYTVEFKHHSPITVTRCINRKDAIDRAVNQLRNWSGINTKTAKKQAVTHARRTGFSF